MKKKLINNLLKKLFPINRSITGKGFLLSLKILNSTSKIIKIKSIQSGKKVFDWKIPKIWNLHEAYISYNRKKIIDIKKILYFRATLNQLSEIYFEKLKKYNR